MAKTVTERRLAIVVELTKEGADPIEVKVRGDYEVESDGVTEGRSLDPIALTGAQETQLINFGVQVVREQILNAEGV